MTPLKTGALAVMLILAIPILLGYGMASETVKETVYIEDDTVNMTDLVLNSESNIYSSYIGPNNNRYLRSYGGLVLQPDYLEITSTPSAIPIGSGYADPAYGWSIPGDSVGNHYATWTNGQLNKSVTLDIEFVSEGDIEFYVHSPNDSFDTGMMELRYTTTLGLVYAYDGTAIARLGDFTHARVIFDFEAGTFTMGGIDDWNSIGEPNTIINPYVVDIGMRYHGGLRQISIAESSDGLAIYRVSSAEIQTSVFPVTRDYTFSPIGYFPESTLMSVYFNSIGVYGDSIEVAGRTFTDSPLHKTVMMSYDKPSDIWYVLYDGETMLVENGDEVFPTIVFNGTWSLTITGSFYHDEEQEITRWASGEFAFDQDDFLLAIILSTVAVFVGLGLMKGVRIGILLIVCSVAGIIAFILV